MTRQQAIDLHSTKWWEKATHEEIARFQIGERMCCEWSVFHKAVEKTLGRSVYSHEFGFNWLGLRKELLEGGPAPTMEEIIEMIPPDKVILIQK